MNRPKCARDFRHHVSLSRTRGTYNLGVFYQRKSTAADALEILLPYRKIPEATLEQLAQFRPAFLQSLLELFDRGNIQSSRELFGPRFPFSIQQKSWSSLQVQGTPGSPKEMRSTLLGRQLAPQEKEKVGGNEVLVRHDRSQAAGRVPFVEQVGMHRDPPTLIASTPKHPNIRRSIEPLLIARTAHAALISHRHGLMQQLRHQLQPLFAQKACEQRHHELVAHEPEEIKVCFVVGAAESFRQVISLKNI